MGPVLEMGGCAYLAAANDQHILGLDLPGEDEAASALNLWELVLLCAHAAHRPPQCLGVVLLVSWRARGEFG
jgi:hypothetical protein